MFTVNGVHLEAMDQQTLSLTLCRMLSNTTARGSLQFGSSTQPSISIQTLRWWTALSTEYVSPRSRRRYVRDAENICKEGNHSYNNMRMKRMPFRLTVFQTKSVL